MKQLFTVEFESDDAILPTEIEAAITKLLYIYPVKANAAQQSTQEEDCPCGGKHVPEPVCKNCGLRYLLK